MFILLCIIFMSMPVCVILFSVTILTRKKFDVTIERTKFCHCHWQGFSSKVLGPGQTGNVW